MGDLKYVGLSILISFIGPFYFLEEKIYNFNEAERIARETCISFNQEMKPFWHKLQDRIFKPGHDQEAYLGSVVQKLVTARSRIDFGVNKADEVALNFETIYRGKGNYFERMENLAKYMRHRENGEKKALQWNFKHSEISYDDLVQSTNHVKRYILQIDEMLADFTKMEKYLERGMAKCRDLESFFGNRTGIIDINVEGSMMLHYESFVEAFRQHLPTLREKMEKPAPTEQMERVRQKFNELGEHFKLLGDTTKFPRWITHFTFGDSFINDTIKAAQKAHTDIHAYHTHLYEFTEPDENGQMKLTDEQKIIAADWVHMNSTIVSSIAKRNIKDLFYDLKWQHVWKHYNTTAKMFKKHSRHQVAERDYAQEVEPYLNITENAFEKFKKTEISPLTYLQDWLEASAGTLRARALNIEDIKSTSDPRWYKDERVRMDWGKGEFGERLQYYIKKVWMPKAGDFGVKIKYTNSVAMDLSWIEDTN